MLRFSGDCGGTAGLYLGVSFCSLLELGYFFAKHTIDGITNRRKENKVDSVTELKPSIEDNGRAWTIAEL